LNVYKNSFLNTFISNLDTKVSFELTRSLDEFYLMKHILDEDKDATQYKAILTNCCLYVKIATMSEPLFRDFSTRFQREDIKYHYRKIVVKPMTVGPNSQQFISNNLFPDSETPLKIHFVLVQTSALQGGYYSNPYGFYRRWTVKKTIESKNISAEVENHYLKDQMAELRAEMRRNMALFLEMSQRQFAPSQAEDEEDLPLASTSKGKAPLRGKGRAKNRNLRPYPPTRKDIGVEMEAASDSASENSFVTAQTNTSSIPEAAAQTTPASNQILLETEEIVYIKSFELELNSSPIDQVKN